MITRVYQALPSTGEVSITTEPDGARTVHRVRATGDQFDAGDGVAFEVVGNMEFEGLARAMAARAGLVVKEEEEGDDIEDDGRAYLPNATRSACSGLADIAALDFAFIEEEVGAMLCALGDASHGRIGPDKMADALRSFSATIAGAGELADRWAVAFAHLAAASERHRHGDDRK